MKKFITGLLVIIFVPVFTQAQDLADALRYSGFQVQGTARAGAMGNAFGALGGDFTSVSINPAGLGLYRAGEFVLTPAFGQSKVETSYRGNFMEDSKYNFSFSNLSYVSTLQTGNNSETGLVNVNVGIGYNRLKDFNTTMLAGASDLDGSFLDYVADNATIGNWSDHYEELAWQTDLLLYDEENNVYWHDLEEAGYGQSQQKSTAKEGSIDEYSLALGLNFNHKLYLGASIGIIDVFYNESSELLEEDENNSIPYFNSMRFSSKLTTNGTGYNGKIGIIYKPVNQVRIGASLQTPTFYNLHDAFDTQMNSSITYDEGDMENYEDYHLSDYDYDLETPLRATLSGAFVIAKKGLISLDYEFVDYSSSSLRRGGGNYNFVDENSEIAEAYRAVGNLRIGGELLATSNISLRAGYELYPSPYNSAAFGVSQPNADASTNVLSAGLGYRSGGFFFDIAYRMTSSDAYDSLYPAPPTDFYTQPEMAHIETSRSQVLFSLGFKF